MGNGVKRDFDCGTQKRLRELPGFELQAKVFQYMDFKGYTFYTDIPAFSKIAQALNILIQLPQLIEKLFDNQYLNGQGIYYVKVAPLINLPITQVCQDGIWRFILIDDFVPVAKLQIIRYMPDEEVLFWPLLLIKALAKVYETFQNLSTLEIDELIFDLTGSPITRLRKKEMPYRWGELQRALDSSHILLAWFGGPNRLFRDMITATFGDRASLQIANVFEFQNSGKSARVVQVRLPSGSRVQVGGSCNHPLRPWTGRFSETSAQWPAAIRKMVGVSEKSVDSVFLCFETEFLDIFDWVDVFRIQEEYLYQAMQTNVVRSSYSVRTFQLSYPASCFLGLVQQSQRYQRRKVLERYGDCVIFLCKKNVDGTQYITPQPPLIDSLSFVQALHSCDRSAAMGLYLQPGRYFAVFWLDQTNQLKQRICFFYYGDQETQLERISGKQCGGIFFSILSGVRKARNSGPQGEINFAIEENIDQQVLTRRLEFRQAKLIFFQLLNTSQQTQKYRLLLPECTVQLTFRNEKAATHTLPPERNVILRADEQLMFLFKYY